MLKLEKQLQKKDKEIEELKNTKCSMPHSQHECCIQLKEKNSLYEALEEENRMNRDGWNNSLTELQEKDKEIEELIIELLRVNYEVRQDSAQIERERILNLLPTNILFMTGNERKIYNYLKSQINKEEQ